MSEGFRGAGHGEPGYSPGRAVAYCQDNETSWYDWDLTTGSADLLRFVRGFLGLQRFVPVHRSALLG
jgi:pullulanase/glycogen debranching enzyme